MVIISFRSFFIFLVFSNVFIANAILNLEGLNMEEIVKVGTGANFHLLPKSSSSSSSGTQHGLNPSNEARPRKLVVRSVKNIHFHALPKGPVPPSAPSHGCSTPPCKNEVN
ncbi:hypothetical protein DEO72_LG9g532 [Vigna unguiculata]|uniref:Uncharacterized protein n=1 Tax=Vigna unguiculata TaxID=3917 RepID=A0A4D6MZC1_VIGUN|nr:hypothetical protein DEO72_LG9g532 [Vigna unguiculata]